MGRWVLICAVGVVHACGDSGRSGDGETGGDGGDDGSSGPSSADGGTADGGEGADTASDDAGQCTEGDSQPCYPGPDGTEGVGVCAAGTKTCANGRWSTCEAAVVPADDEICNDLDDDCNGTVDDACVEWHVQPDQTSAVYGLAFDGTGDVFVAGVYAGSAIDLGGGPLAQFGDWDVFVARFSAAGAHVWSRGMGSTAEDEGRSVALDGVGNLYVTGAMNGDADIGGNMHTGLGGTDLFVARYSVDGQHQWSRLYGSTGREIGNDVAIDAMGGPVVAGSFSGETDLGDGPQTAVARDDVFLVRLTPTGDPIWSRVAGSADSQDDHGWTVAVSPVSGDVFFGGAFRSTINLGGADLTAEFRLDMFLARYTVDGTHVWSMSEGSGAEDDLYAMDIDANGDLIVAGRGSSQLDFGITAMGGDGQAVVAKLDPDGNAIWVRRSQGGFNEDYATTMAVAAGPFGEVFAAGYFRGRIDYGDGVDTDLRGREIETYITKIDADGSYVWGRSFGEDGNDYGWAVAAGPGGESVYGGSLGGFEGRMFMTAFGAGG